MGFLDYTGLNQYTNKFQKFIMDKLTKLLETKQNSLTAGDGVFLKSDVIGVVEPVKKVTQFEYDSLSEEEKSTGLYIVTDANIGLRDEGDLYSTEETRIGTWIDGKPLYRRVLEKHMTASVNVFTPVVTVDKTCEIKSFIGFFQPDHNNGSAFEQLPSSNINGEVMSRVYFDVANSCFNILLRIKEFSPFNLRLIYMYTKTTDQIPANQTTLLASKVSNSQNLTVDSSLDSLLTVTFPSINSTASEASEKVLTSKVPLPSTVTYDPAFSSVSSVTFPNVITISSASASSTSFTL